MYFSLHEKCVLFLSDFKEIWICSTNVRNHPPPNIKFYRNMFSGSHVVSCRRMDRHDEVNKSLLITLQTHTKEGVTDKTHKANFSIGRNTQILSLCDTSMYLNQEIIITLMYTVILFYTGNSKGNIWLSTTSTPKQKNLHRIVSLHSNSTGLNHWAG
jgi:hypothetical protein